MHWKRRRGEQSTALGWTATLSTKIKVDDGWMGALLRSMFSLTFVLVLSGMRSQEAIEKKLALDMITPQYLLQDHEREAVTSVVAIARLDGGGVRGFARACLATSARTPPP